MANFKRLNGSKGVYKAVQHKGDGYRIIKTLHGDATITDGNWVVTDPEGNMFGMTPVDFEAQFTKLKK